MIFILPVRPKLYAQEDSDIDVATRGTAAAGMTK